MRSNPVGESEFFSLPTTCSTFHPLHKKIVLDTFKNKSPMCYFYVLKKRDKILLAAYCKTTYLSMQIFSTWGTRTWSILIIVWRGSFCFHDWTYKKRKQKLQESKSRNKEFSSTWRMKPLSNSHTWEPELEVSKIQFFARWFTYFLVNLCVITDLNIFFYYRVHLISPYSLHTQSSIQVMRIKKDIN